MTALSPVHSLPGIITLVSVKPTPGTTNLSEVVKSVPGTTGVDTIVGIVLLVVVVLLVSEDLFVLVKWTAKTMAIMATIITVGFRVNIWNMGGSKGWG